MEKERLQEYAARVTQANRSELVVIIYEATLASIEEGKNYLKQGEIEAARAAARNGLASRSASTANRFNFQYAYLPETEEPVWEGRLLTNVGYYHD